MDFNNLEPYEWIKNLKCTICGHFLSYFPVYITELNQNICGRCSDVTKSEVKLIRNKMYETVSQEILFQCCYTSEGCCERRKPKDVRNHELNCSFKTSKCPTADFTQCEEKVSRANELQHCEEKHQNIFLKNGSFNIDLSKTETCYNILEHNNQLLIAKRKFSKENKSFQFSFKGSGSDQLLIAKRKFSKENKSFQFSLKGSGSLLAPYDLEFKCGTRELHVKCTVNADTYVNEISFHSLVDPQQKSRNVFGQISIKDSRLSTTNVKDLNKNLLNLSKCPNCSASVLPPVNLFSQNARCSKCGNCYGNASFRNSLMDKLLNLLEYPCKNSVNGCQFTSVPELLKDHEKGCRFGLQACPVKDYGSCKWNGLSKDLQSHLLKDHEPLLVGASSISENVTQLQNHSYDDRFTKCYILKFGHYFFNLVFLQKDNKLFWIVQAIGEFEHAFTFEIEITGHGNKQKIVVSQPCSKMCSKADLVSNLSKYYCFPYDQIRTVFLEKDILHFKIRIFKKS